MYALWSFQAGYHFCKNAYIMFFHWTYMFFFFFCQTAYKNTHTNTIFFYVVPLVSFLLFMFILSNFKHFGKYKIPTMRMLIMGSLICLKCRMCYACIVHGDIYISTWSKYVLYYILFLFSSYKFYNFVLIFSDVLPSYIHLLKF